MKQSDVNDLITDRVDEMENGVQREFVNWVLQFERENMDKENAPYKQDYRNKIEDLDLSSAPTDNVKK